MRDIKPLIENNRHLFIGVKISKTKIEKIHDVVTQIIMKKLTEKHHMTDDGKEYERFYTGFLGEAALEKFLNREFIDWSVGNSIKYNVADLGSLGVNIGVKTVEFPKFPIINKTIKRPEVINFKLSDDMVLICGIAGVDTLKQYQDDDLILSPNLRRRNTKTGFYGFENLQTFKTLDDIKQIIKEK